MCQPVTSAQIESLKEEIREMERRFCEDSNLHGGKGWASYFEENGKKIGGKNFEENGKRASMTYKFKEMGKMMHIDIVVKIVGEKNSHSLLRIAEKIDANSFKMQLGYNNVRPKTFDKNETAIFTRVK